MRKFELRNFAKI